MTDYALSYALQWIAALLTGTIATSVCVLATATLGLLMLSGSLPVARGVRVLIGCFIVFGAPVFANALTAYAAASTSDARGTITAPPPAVDPPTQPYDPYAGASILQ